MNNFCCKCLFIILLTYAPVFPKIYAQINEKVACTSKKSPCFLKSITCPAQCPTQKPNDRKAKACYVNITWIQSLGVVFGSHNLSVEATEAAEWDSSIDHLRFLFDGRGFSSSWRSAEGEAILERVTSTNSAIISLREIAEIGVTVVPITKEDDRIHNYQIPSDDCFAHLEVLFRFFHLSPEVEGVLSRTYRPDYESHTRLGIAMPVVGGEDKYKASSLFAADCKKCVFSSKNGDRLVA